MSAAAWIIVLALLVGAYVWYAVIVKRRNRVSEALAGIDVQLNQRHDLIPNLLKIARRFMEHERTLFEEITTLRAKALSHGNEGGPAAMAEKFAVEDQLGAGLGRLFAVVENYPALRSDGPMIEAQRAYQEVETNIAAARRFYNAAVGDLSNAIQIFPGQLLAGLAGVRSPPPFFKTEAAVRLPSMQQRIWTVEVRVARTNFSWTASTTFVGFALAGIATFVAVLVASVRKTPGWEGLLSGTIGGFLAGLFVAAAGAGLAMKMLTVAPTPPRLDDETANALAAVLAALEATRLDIVKQVRARAFWRVPLGIAAGAALWAMGDDGEGLFGLALKAGIGGLAGEFWAAHALGERYRRLYKDRVLPLLAARFGAITYRAARPPDMGRLRDEKIFRDFDTVTAEDELVGIYNGLAISIVELKLELGSGKSRRTIFDGLLAEVELPRRLQGDTAVLPDGGTFGNLRDWFARGARERVRLEDPRFEAAYEVWATDQITARALLTPAFVERFRNLAELPGFGPPLALAQDERLLLVLPGPGRNLFEPPSFRRPAAGRTALAELHRDIAAVLAVADATIDLDYAGRAVAADHHARTETFHAAASKE